MIFQQRQGCISALFIVLAMSISSLANALESEPPSEQELQRTQLIEWLSGDFSNFYPLTRDPEELGNFPPVLQRGKVHTLANGETVLVVKQSMLNQPDQAYRRHLYRFVAMPRQERLVQITYPLNDDSVPDSVEDLARLPGCEIHWQAHEDAFEGYRSPERCYFRNSEGQRIHMESTLRATANSLVISDAVVDSEGEIFEDIGPGATFQAERIRFLNLTGAFLPPGANSDADDAWIDMTLNGRLHDHGQRMNLKTRADERTLPFQLSITRDDEDSERIHLRIYSVGQERAMTHVEITRENGTWEYHNDSLRISIQH
ncbi:MAG: hypothetical protein JJU10_07495 [Idiomarina sp.]|nr:hypothetical protein [Idiomarina sp.]